MKTMKSRVMAKIVVDSNGHWIWSGGETVRGGNTSLRPRRLLWEMHKGAVPAGHCVVSVCGVLKCVSPEEGHSSLATAKYVFKKVGQEAVALVVLPVAEEPIPETDTPEKLRLAKEACQRIVREAMSKNKAGFPPLTNTPS